MRRFLRKRLWLGGACVAATSLGLLPFGGGTAIASETPAIPLSPPPCIGRPAIPQSRAAIPQTGGVIKAVGDYVHVTTTNKQASGHGWWVYVSGTMPPNGVTVTVTLQAWLTTPECPGYYSVARSSGVLYLSGGGSGNRITAKATCASTVKRLWRSVVTVVVNTYPSSTGSVTTSPQTRACTPS
jgi:hypothetical protein